MFSSLQAFLMALEPTQPPRQWVPAVKQPQGMKLVTHVHLRRLRLKCNGLRAKTRFCLSAKWTSPFKSAGSLVQSTTGSRGVRISGSNGSNTGYTMFRGNVKGTVYPFHSAVSPSLPLLCVSLCHHFSTGHYYQG